jgi:hypothetical protein
MCAQKKMFQGWGFSFFFYKNSPLYHDEMNIIFHFVPTETHFKVSHTHKPCWKKKYIPLWILTHTFDLKPTSCLKFILLMLYNLAWNRSSLFLFVWQ